MATVLEECITEKQHSALCFLWAKDSMQRIFIKKCFLFMVESVCCMKWFTSGPLKNHLGGKRFADDVEVELEVLKWLRRQSKDVYAAGFDELVKRWEK
jgi:hypothetical protein